MAAIFGVLAGIFYIIVTAIVNSQVSKPGISITVKVCGYLLLFVILGLFATIIKKRNGGYLQFKHTFGAIFVMLFIANLFNYLFNYVYIEYIDPDYVYKLKAATIAVVQQNKPADAAKAAADMDIQIAQSKTFSLGNNLMNFLMVVLYSCLPGLITAAIVKKNTPE